MNISVEFVDPPIPTRNFDWQAIDTDTYDGSPESTTRYQIGRGPTKEAAVADLLEILADVTQQ